MPATANRPKKRSKNKTTHERSSPPSVEAPLSSGKERKGNKDQMTLDQAPANDGDYAERAESDEAPD